MVVTGFFRAWSQTVVLEAGHKPEIIPIYLVGIKFAMLLSGGCDSYYSQHDPVYDGDLENERNFDLI
jgi:hypothetical protein